MRQFILFIGLILCSLRKVTSAGCSISINSDLSDPQPLFLKANNSLTGIEALLEPIDNAGTIQLTTKEKITIACAGSEIKILDESIGKSITTASCKSGSTLTIGRRAVPVLNITCEKHAEQILRYNGKSCGRDKRFKEIELGYEIDKDRFFEQLIVCYDNELRNTPYSYFHLTSAIGGSQVNYPRVPFKEAGFYKLGKIKVDSLYTRNVQRKIINRLLSLPDDSTEYIHASNDYYLARGHLAAKTDFVYGSEQRLTFNFVNAAPQWQTLNAGNWLRLEDSVRNYASENNRPLIVYTGTHEILTLPNAETGEETEIFLYNEEFQAVPVPALFWKVVYDPRYKSGVAFIALNNPYQEDYEPICEDICNQVSWPTWDPSSQKSGFGYCCDVNEFRSIVVDLPMFKVETILTG